MKNENDKGRKNRKTNMALQVQLDEFQHLCEEIGQIYTHFDIKHHNNDNNKK